MLNTNTLMQFSAADGWTDTGIPLPPPGEELGETEFVYDFGDLDVRGFGGFISRFINGPRKGQFLVVLGVGVLSRDILVEDMLDLIVFFTNYAAGLAYLGKEPEIGKVRCELCMFWSEGEKTGLCKRRPPHAEYGWAITKKTDFCGEGR
jgi:hypothetical protein